MKCSLWTYTVFISSSALALVYGSKFSTENAITDSNEKFIDYEPLNSLLESRFSHSEIELITSKPDDMEWFQGLSSAKNQLNVEIALAIGLAIQNAFSDDVMRIVLKHVAKSFHSLPEYIVSNVWHRTFKLAVEIKDFESCSVLLMNNPKTFQYVFYNLKVEEAIEIIKFINRCPLEMSKFLNDLENIDFNVYFNLIYIGISEDLFLESFIKSLENSRSYYLPSLRKQFISTESFIDCKEFIGRFSSILGKIQLVFESRNDSKIAKVVEEASRIVVLFGKIYESSETGEFDEVVELFKSEIDYANTAIYSESLKMLAFRLAAVDSDSFLKIYEERKEFIGRIPENALKTLKDPSISISSPLEHFAALIPDHYNFVSYKIDEDQNINFVFTLRDDCLFILKSSLPKQIESSIKIGFEEFSCAISIHGLLICLLDAIPDLDEQKVYDFFTFMSENFSIEIGNYEYYSPSIEIMKAIAFSPKLNEFFMSKKIVFRPEIHVTAELIKYSAATNSKIVLDKSVCNFYCNLRTMGNKCIHFAQFELYKYFNLKVHFDILESLTGTTFADSYLEVMNETYFYPFISEIEFHEFRIAFKNWINGPQCESLKTIKNAELYQKLVQDY